MKGLVWSLRCRCRGRRGEGEKGKKWMGQQWNHEIKAIKPNKVRLSFLLALLFLEKSVLFIFSTIIPILSVLFTPLSRSAAGAAVGDHQSAPRPHK